MTLWGTAVDKSPAIPFWVQQACYSNVVNKLKSTDLNVGQAIGEARESVQTITSILGDIKNLISWRSFAKRAGRAAARSASNKRFDDYFSNAGMASQYLRYIYGIKPMMSDIFAAAQVIENGLGEGQLDVVSATMIDSGFELPTWASSQKLRAEGECTRGITCQFAIKVANPTYYQLWRYGLTNPIAVAWEVFPMSFVIDWFIHLGNFLSAIDVNLAVESSDGFQTLWLRNDFDVIKDLTVEGPRIVPISGSPDMKVKVKTKAMSRQTLNAVPIPLPYVYADLNVSKAVSLCALIVANLGKLK
jgi:hypothetical protein